MTPEATTPLERAERSLRALSLGDAFGEQFFFNADGYVFADTDVLEMARTRTIPGPVPRSFTDDTVMTISVVDTLRERGHVDQDRLAELFGRRYQMDWRRGYGGTAHEILRKIADGEGWRSVSRGAFDGGGSMGNGGAMRAAPIGAYFFDDLDRAVEEARRSAEVTHAHAEGQAGAVAVAVAAAMVARGGATAADLFESVLDRTPSGEVWAGCEKATRLPLSYDVRTAVSALGNGRRVTAPDTVPFTLWCAARHLDDFEEAMWQTVAGLGDRDTTCAIVAGILGCDATLELPSGWDDATEPLSAMTLAT